jgi:exosortase D (VPLPA-CTERM-specific)
MRGVTMFSEIKSNRGFRLPLAVQGIGALCLGLAVVAAVAVFWQGFESLLDAWQTPEYSYGPVIPFLSAYIFLREMKSVPPTDRPVTDRWPGVAVVAVALLIGLLGNIVRISDIITYAFIFWVGGMVLVCFGFRRGWCFWPSVLHLVFMLPLPQFIYWQVSIFLQTVSSQIGVEVIALIGIPVYLDGNVIDLGVYKLLVAEACSGLRYLFPVMSFSFVYAVLYTGPVWHKVVLLLSAAPITVLMNSFRIGVIGILVDNFGIAQAEGFLHVFEGWVIFTACIVILFGLAALMQRLQPNPRPLGETIDLEFSGISRQIRRAGTIVPSPALITAMLLAVTVALGWHLAPAPPLVTVEREPLVLFPDRLGDWHGRSGRIEPTVEQVLGADDYYIAKYTNPAEAQPVDLFVAWYAKQTEGDGIHSPQVCIPAGGWEVSEWATTIVTLATGETVPVVRAIIQKGLVRKLVYYWFELRGRRLTNDYVAKAYTVWDSATIGRTDGAIVRLVTPIGSRESEVAGEARLARFMAESLPLIPRFVPK